jgi:hypothetical protein
MKIVIVFFSILQLLLELKLTSSQNVLLVPGFIPLIHDMDQHALIVVICYCQSLDCKCFLVTITDHLL